MKTTVALAAFLLFAVSTFGQAAQQPQSAHAPMAGIAGYGTPTCVYCPNAPYPKEASDNHEQGTVTVELVVSAQGQPSDVRVVTTAGYGMDEAAVAAVRRWRFKPATGPDGKPATVRTKIMVTFHLY